MFKHSLYTSQRAIKRTDQQIDKARDLKINPSRTLEERLSQLVREAAAEEWLAANRKAVDAYSARGARWRLERQTQGLLMARFEVRMNLNRAPHLLDRGRDSPSPSWTR